MKADQQTDTGMLLAETGNSHAPAVHPLLLVLQHVSKIPRKIIKIPSLRNCLPFPPAVVVFSNGQHRLRTRPLGLVRVREVSGSGKLIISPVGRQKPRMTKKRPLPAVRGGE